MVIFLLVTMIKHNSCVNSCFNLVSFSQKVGNNFSCYYFQNFFCNLKQILSLSSVSIEFGHFYSNLRNLFPIFLSVIIVIAGICRHNIFWENDPIVIQFDILHQYSKRKHKFVIQPYPPRIPKTRALSYFHMSYSESRNSKIFQWILYSNTLTYA